MNEHLLDPKIIANVDNYSLLARTIVEGFIAGLHRSLYQGFGSEFVHYRNYSPGDDIKYIDWKVYARSNKFQMKVYEEETNTNCYIILDASASMAYSGDIDRSTKLHYAKIMCACFAYLINRQGDNVGFYAYNDMLRTCIKPGHRSGHVHSICSQLERLNPIGKGDHNTILRKLGELCNRRGIMVLVSDFLDFNEELAKTIKYFKFAHHDCILIQVLDDDEVNFPFQLNVRFIDSESKDELTTYPELVRQKYLHSFNNFMSNFKRFCGKNDIDVEHIVTSSSLMNILAAFLHRRELYR